MPGQVKTGLVVLAIFVAVIVVGELRDRGQAVPEAPPIGSPVSPTTEDGTAPPQVSTSETPAEKSEEDPRGKAIFFELVSCEDRVTADAAAKIPDDYSSAKAGAAGGGGDSLIILIISSWRMPTDDYCGDNGPGCGDATSICDSSTRGLDARAQDAKRRRTIARGGASGGTLGYRFHQTPQP